MSAPSKDTIPCEKCEKPAHRVFGVSGTTGWADDWSTENNGKGRFIPQFAPPERGPDDRYFSSPKDVEEYAKKRGHSTSRT